MDAGRQSDKQIQLSLTTISIKVLGHTKEILIVNKI